MRKLVLSPEDSQPGLMSRNLLGEPAMLECLSGEARGLARVITRLSKIDENGEKVFAQGFYNAIEYEVDEDGSLVFDDEEGTAGFSSRGVQYKIRAIQESDGSAWAALQEAKRG